MGTEITKEIKELLASYKSAEKSKKSKIRRALRAKGFSLRAWNKENAPEKPKAVVKAKAEKVTPKAKAPKAIKPTKVAKAVTVPADDEEDEA